MLLAFITYFLELPLTFTSWLWNNQQLGDYTWSQYGGYCFRAAGATIVAFILALLFNSQILFSLAAFIQALAFYLEAREYPSAPIAFIILATIFAGLGALSAWSGMQAILQSVMFTQDLTENDSSGSKKKLGFAVPIFMGLAGIFSTLFYGFCGDHTLKAATAVEIAFVVGIVWLVLVVAFYIDASCKSWRVCKLFLLLLGLPTSVVFGTKPGWVKDPKELLTMPNTVEEEDFY